MPTFLRATLLLALASVAGCLVPNAGLPSGVAATGEPVRVVDDVEVWTTTSHEKVGDAEYKDADGRTVGTAAVYADRTELHAARVWYPMQGHRRLSDEDFFRITGDQASLDATVSLRARGERWHRRGLYAMGGGLIAFVAGYFVDGTLSRTLLISGGSLTMLGGYYVAWWGGRQMDPDTHAVGRDTADEAAQRYDQSLGHVVGLSVSRSF